MYELFKKIFESKGIKLNDLKIQQYANNLIALTLISILGESEKLFNDNDNANLENFLRNKDINGIMLIIENKYPKEELAGLLKRHAQPILDSYLKEVSPN